MSGRTNTRVRMGSTEPRFSKQYKLYVEMADRISASWRTLANTFFVTLNTVVLTLIGALWKGHPHVEGGWLVIPLATPARALPRVVLGCSLV